MTIFGFFFKRHIVSFKIGKETLKIQPAILKAFKRYMCPFRGVFGDMLFRNIKKRSHHINYLVAAFIIEKAFLFH